MAETTGLVQRLTVLPSLAMACVWIGPSPTNAELLFVSRTSGESAEDGAFESSMVDALTMAAAHRREVAAVHSDTGARITSLRFHPA